jgi:putative ABC transport system permease protein
MGDLLQDLRYAVRVFAKNPGFSIVAVIALALGIGATTAIFSVANSVLLRPLPYADPDHLMVIRETRLPSYREFSVSPGNFTEWQDQNSALQQITVYRGESFTLIGGGDPERIQASTVSAGLISMLGARPAYGRTFTTEEDRAGRGTVAIISYGLWQRRFAGDLSILGQPINLSGSTYTVVGIMPPSFMFPERNTDVWLPIALDEKARQDHFSHYLQAIGRLKSGATVSDAQTEFTAIAGRLQQQYPATNGGWDVKIAPMLDYVVRDVRTGLRVLLGAVASVLLIACGNVANLLLARSAGREKEFAIRAALGAGRLRVVRHLLTESLVLALCGGGLGLLFSAWGVKMLLLFAPEDLPRIKQVSIDARVLLFTLSLTLLTGIIFGLAPALQAARINLTGSLKQGGHYGQAGSGGRIRSALVVLELAMALIMLVGGGLLIRSFWRLRQINPGFNPDHAIALKIPLSGKYSGQGRAAAFTTQLIQTVSAMPGVESVGATDVLPLGNSNMTYFGIQGRPLEPASERPTTNYYAVSSEYFKSMGIPLLRGRFFDEGDVKGAKPVAIINETMALRYFPDQDPIGAVINMAGEPKFHTEIVGVVGDVTQEGLDTVNPVQTYQPLMQQPPSSLSLVVRSAINPMALGPAIRSEVLSIDSEQPVTDIRPLDQILSKSLASRRFEMGLLVTFASVSLILASIGLYGVMSYSVTERRREIGIRMALGAGRERVLGDILKRGALLTAVGIGAGLAGAFAATRLMADLLFKVSTTDFVTFAAVSGVLAGVSLAASFIPALKATRVDPIVALRCE